MKNNLPSFAVGGAVAAGIEGQDPNIEPTQEFNLGTEQGKKKSNLDLNDDQSAVPGTVNEYGFEKTSNLLKAGFNAITKSKTPVFNSAVKKAVENIAEKGSGEQILGSIKNVPGVKANEIKWIGLDDFLKGKKSVTKKEVIDFVEANRIDVTEVVFPKTGKDFGMYDEMLQTVKNDREKYIMSLDRSMSGGDYDHLQNFDSIKIKNFSDETFNGHTLEELDFNQFTNTDIFKYINGFTDPNTFYTDINALIKSNGVNNNKQVAFYLVEDNKSGRIKILNKREIGKNPRKYKEKNPNSGGTYKHIFTSGLDVKELEKFALENRTRYLNGKKSAQDGTTQYERYTEPGGEDYKELILKYRQSGVLKGTQKPIPVETNVTKYDDLDSFDIQESPHFKEPNELAQVRFKTRNLNGKKLLSVEEMQSDLVQGVKKSNKDFMEDTIPNIDGEVENMNAIDNIIKDFPFKNNWYELAIKRLVRYAADNGFDAISIPKGSVIQDRYQLTKKVESINITFFDDVRKEVGLMARDQNGITQIDDLYTFDRIEKEFGKDVLDKVIKRGPDINQSKPLIDYPQSDYPFVEFDKPLRIGGEGKNSLYDKALPAYFKKYGKKWNAKVYDDVWDGSKEATTIRSDGVKTVSPGFDRKIPLTIIELTPAMKKSVQEEGQSLFEILGIGGAGAVGAKAVSDSQGNNTISNLTQ